MISIKPLYLMLLVEYGILVSGLCVFLFVRWKRGAKGPAVREPLASASVRAFSPERLRSILEAERERLASGGPGNGGSEESGVQTGHDDKARKWKELYLAAVSELIQRGGADESDLSYAILRGFERTLDQAQAPESAAEPSMGISQTLTFPADRPEIAEKFHAFFKAQRMRIAELHIAEKSVEYFREKVKELQKRNRELRRKLQALQESGRASSKADLEWLVAELEKSNEELQAWVGRLEEENREHLERIRRYEAEMNSEIERLLSDLSSSAGGPPMELQTPTDSVQAMPEPVPGGLEAEVAELRKTLAEKEREIEKLKQNNRKLEREYRRVYVLLTDQQKAKMAESRLEEKSAA